MRNEVEEGNERTAIFINWKIQEKIGRKLDRRFNLLAKRILKMMMTMKILKNPFLTIS